MKSWHNPTFNLIVHHVEETDYSKTMLSHKLTKELLICRMKENEKINFYWLWAVMNEWDRVLASMPMRRWLLDVSRLTKIMSRYLLTGCGGLLQARPRSFEYIRPEILGHVAFFQVETIIHLDGSGITPVSALLSEGKETPGERVVDDAGGVLKFAVFVQNGLWWVLKVNQMVITHWVWHIQNSGRIWIEWCYIVCLVYFGWMHDSNDRAAWW